MTMTVTKHLQSEFTYYILTSYGSRAEFPFKNKTRPKNRHREDFSNCLFCTAFIQDIIFVLVNKGVLQI